MFAPDCSLQWNLTNPRGWTQVTLEEETVIQGDNVILFALWNLELCRRGRNGEVTLPER